MIVGIGFEHDKFCFPCGEMHVRIKDFEVGRRVSLHFLFEKNEDLVELLLVCDAIKRCGMILEGIAMPYVPFGRQDRVAVQGESLSLKVFCDLLNSCEAKIVNITDHHSDVTTALIKNVVVLEQWEVFERYFEGKKNFYLISPDGGALKKIYKLASKVDCKGVIEFSKQRNTRTGEITGVIGYPPRRIDGVNDFYIVDDICDGGRTFIEISKVIKSWQTSGKVILCVTHGFFTKGLGVFEGLIDEIYTLKGRVK
jgi:ribose-phosphate pyrophosphokinase